MGYVDAFWGFRVHWRDTSFPDPSCFPNITRISNKKEHITPPKTKMEPQNGGLVQMIFLFTRVMFRFYVKNFKLAPKRSKRHLTCHGHHAMPRVDHWLPRLRPQETERNCKKRIKIIQLNTIFTYLYVFISIHNVYTYIYPLMSWEFRGIQNQKRPSEAKQRPHQLHVLLPFNSSALLLTSKDACSIF